MRPIQYFSKEYLENCRKMHPTQTLQFLEDFKALQQNIQSDPSRLISIKIPQSLLRSFKTKANLQGTPYQTQIKRLMREWLS
jgi:predicted DNA binding CopG/RHH family protein